MAGTKKSVGRKAKGAVRSGATSDGRRGSVRPVPIPSGKSSARATGLRREMRGLVSRLSRALDVLASAKQPLVKGVFQNYGVRCGKASCWCNDGHLHDTGILAAYEDGKRHSIYVRKRDRPRIQRQSAEYRRLRKARAEVVRLSEAIAELSDALIDALAEEYAPRRGE